MKRNTFDEQREGLVRTIWLGVSVAL